MSHPRPTIQNVSIFVFCSLRSRVPLPLKIFARSMVSSGHPSKMHALHWDFFLMTMNGTSVWRRQVLWQQDISSGLFSSPSFMNALYQIQGIYGIPTATDFSTGTFERIHPMKMFGTMVSF